MYDRTVHWNDIGNTSAGNGERVKDDDNREKSHGGYECMWYVLVVQEKEKRVCA